ncbi:hypothetical protein EV175_002069, partial [Coemansia sp. RSA 1933]
VPGGILFKKATGSIPRSFPHEIPLPGIEQSAKLSRVIPACVKTGGSFGAIPRERIVIWAPA